MTSKTQSHIQAIGKPMAAAVLLAAAGWLHGQDIPDYEQPPVSYSATPANDALAKLRQRIASGELAFAGSDKQALQTLLDVLDVPAASQILVFSKTSLQRARIRPDRPRALYFSDSV